MKESWCRLCMQDITKGQTIFDYLKQDTLLCGDCRKQLEVLNQKTKIQKMPLHMIYLYNDFLENMIFQYKEGLDTALRDVFFYDVMDKLNTRFRHYTIVLMPSSEEKTIERGFLPVKEMLSHCKIPIIEPFYKISNHKQSLQTYENRVLISQVIKRNSNIRLPNTKLLLVDDVCTSGNTLISAYKLLQKHPYKIEALVLCAHQRFVDSCDKNRWKRKGMFSIL
ncbi:MAG: phosphoribosyltransferase family protein [Clostridium sp.]